MDQDQLNPYVAYEGYVVRVPRHPLIIPRKVRDYLRFWTRKPDTGVQRESNIFAKHFWRNQFPDENSLRYKLLIMNIDSFS